MTNVISEKLEIIRKNIEEAAVKSGRALKDVTLIAVTKSASNEKILQAKEAGLATFGENKVQEAEAKIQALGPGLEWHMIGHLQSNKVKTAVSLFNLIQSVDSVRLAKTINDEAEAAQKVMNVLLEVNASGEQQKYGFAPEEIYTALDQMREFKSIKILGVMGMAPNSPDEGARRAAFKKLKSIYSVCKSVKQPNLEVKILSMGMSDDYKIAVEEGSNMVRIGRALFA